MAIGVVPTFMIGANGTQMECFTGADSARLEARLHFWSDNLSHT